MFLSNLSTPFMENQLDELLLGRLVRQFAMQLQAPCRSPVHNRYDPMTLMFLGLLQF